MNTIYEFREDDAREFARQQHLRVHVDKRKNELIFEDCPYCRGTTNDKNKFAINLKTGMYNCLRATCGAKGSFLTLARDFNFSLGRDVDEYYNRTRQFRNLKKYGRPESKDAAVEYMKTRGISEVVTKHYGITTKQDQENVIVFPFFDEEGTMQFVKYRKTDFDKERDSSKEWCLADCKPILFGMDRCDPKISDTLVLTEGQIDSLSVAECGIPNAVSVPTGALGFTWVPYCWDFLSKFKTLIVFGDYEKEHITLLKEMSQRFHGTVKHVKEDDYRGCKDANELLMKHGKVAVIQAITDAVIVDNPHIKKMSEVRRPENVVMIDTGIAQLNKIIGGFSPGQLVLLSGERGYGKSTLGSQFLLEAVDQGFTSLVYSGELVDYDVQDWIDRQAAGKDNINNRVSENGFCRYLVQTDALEKIHAWYDDRLYIRDSDLFVDDEEPEPLLVTIRTAIRQYGVKVIMLDNLMTAIEDDLNFDLYRQQAAFVRELAKTAKQMDVLIVLVAHPRKGSGKFEFRNDDISGSANITNLADIVLNYTKPGKDSGIGAPRILQVAKNRVNGKLSFDGIPLYYEDESKRISESKAVMNPKRYGWETEGTEWHEVDGLEEIPF